MALPTFSKTGVTTVIWSKGEVFPYVIVRRPRQVVAESENGDVRISTLSGPRVFHLVTFVRVPLADITAAVAFFEDSLVNWKAETWTYTRSDGSTFLVRLWNDNLETPEVANNLYTLRFTLREEL